MEQLFGDMNTSMQTMNAWFVQNPTVGFLVLVWLFTWKGLALWKAARKNDMVWFIVLFVVNIFSVLEILYYFIISERKKSPSKN